MSTPSPSCRPPSGVHSDELLAAVILTRLYPHAAIVRTREPSWITRAPDRAINGVSCHTRFGSQLR
nr:MYG1 family protein [Paracoccus sp. EF6]